MLSLASSALGFASVPVSSRCFNMRFLGQQELVRILARGKLFLVESRAGQYSLRFESNAPCPTCPPPSPPVCPDPALSTIFGQSESAMEQLQFMSNTESPSVNYIRSLLHVSSVAKLP
eukprot:6214568-Pleurochrysis_carterae.AAC.2